MESLEELHRELVEDFAANPERWMPSDPCRAGEAFRARINQVIRAIEYGTHDDINRALARFVRFSRLERGETVIPFPSRPRRLVSPPADLPPAA
jgi:hypothetical protein